MVFCHDDEQAEFFKDISEGLVGFEVLGAKHFVVFVSEVFQVLLAELVLESF